MARPMDSRTDFIATLEAVRTAFLDAALRAYEDASIQGLCEEGRWEAAIGAVRALDLQAAAGAPKVSSDADISRGISPDSK